MTNNVIAFTRGVPPAESFPVEKLEECTRTVLQQASDSILQYGKAAGYLPLREWVAERYNAPVEQVIIGQGSLQLLDMLVRVSLRLKDRVFMEQPTYDRVLTIFRRSGVGLVGFELKDGLLDFEAIEAKLKSGVIPKYFYTIPDFQNPSGAVMPLEDRKKLIQLAKKYNFYLIEDGPYRQLRYHGQDLPTLYEMAHECVIHMSSFSKLISPGLRVGFMILPPVLVQDVCKFAEDTYINASYLNQAIACDFISRGWLDQNLVELKDLYRPRLDTLLKILDADFQGLADWIKPEGGFFVGLNLCNGCQIPGSETIAKAGLKLSDSQGFFIEGGERFIRLPFCALTPEQIEEGLRRLHQVLAS
jgi:DNA-binding transcriptional MocR family regulator